MVIEYYGDNQEIRLDWKDGHFETLKEVFAARDKRRDEKWQKEHSASLYFSKLSDMRTLKLISD
jgi:hypothetical protein